ncbi:MAG: FAD-binding oxidoreductase [Bdellovibrionales bacterium]|nr:FAD-binding oxidoreductase [Bdellovibrionales bacterium]
MNTDHSETLVVGAGLVGSSLAWHLAALGSTEVTVIDFDLEGTLSSSELNAGGVRATFQQPLNIQASKVSIDFFSKHREEFGYRDCGYLWLVSKDAQEGFRKAMQVQLAEGWEVQDWDLGQLRKKAPFIDKTDDLVGACFAPKDGLINPNLLKNYYRARAREKGVRFLDRTQLVGAEYQASSKGWKLKFRTFPKVLSGAFKEEVLTSSPNQAIGQVGAITEFTAKRVVNAAGAWAKQVAKILGYDCPSVAVRRHVCVFDSRDVDLSPYGMTVDPSGVYFHPEASNGMAGIASPDDPEGYSFQYPGEDFFTEKIWPALYERSSGFEKLKHLTGWAGLYENSPDHSAIIGEVQGVGILPGSLYDCHSFSGHGVMHSYSVGLGLAEKMAKGKYLTLDLQPFSRDRFLSGNLIPEGAVI